MISNSKSDSFDEELNEESMQANQENYVAYPWICKERQSLKRQNREAKGGKITFQFLY